MPDRDTLPSPVISSDRVKGTAVFGAEGRQIGTIDHLVIEKASGRIVYAVMSFGGFLGLGERFSPLPWSVLTYDTGRGGYVVPLSKDRLGGGPHYDRSELTGDDNGWGARVNDYYQVTPSRT